ncbi:helix-turn-helix domain-containing protein [Methylobacterium oryzae]|uniref:helix-turn-helix domain-containing protein n=1 Tax=Methylobacterium oryzae TaxID=334852 RepID=UPI000D14662B|nr:helix-turn-helix domain-containing protein [Methylobacterium oryzae]
MDQDRSQRQIEILRLENFTIDEFSAWARISRTTTYRAIKDRSLIAYKVRGRTIIRRADAEDFAARARMN